MKLVNIRKNEQDSLGVALTAGILDVAATALAAGWTHCPITMDALFNAPSSGLGQLSTSLQHLNPDHAVVLGEDDVDYGPCLPSFGNVLCLGTNYRQHAIESNMAIPTVPLLFGKFRNTLTGHRAAVGLPDNAEQYDYEAELCVVIGKSARYVAVDEALEYVFGYCNANDLSARDLQFRTSQWLLGKTGDGFCPVGPYLVTKDEIANPNQLRIQCWVNGSLKQDSMTADMIFHCAETISYLSQYMTLQPGDIILTGTPEGVVFGKPEAERVWLKPGDNVAVEVAGLGRLENVLTKA